MIAPFLTTSATDKGIDVLQLGSEGNLERVAGSILRLRALTFDGHETLDVHALAVDARTAQMLAAELDAPGSGGLDAAERAGLIERLYALAAHARESDRAKPEAPRERWGRDDLSDPDIVASSEYRALHGLLTDGAGDIDDAETWRQTVLAMLGETIDYANQLLTHIGGFDGH